MSGRPTIAVVTNWWGTYDRFLPAWYAALKSQTVAPDQVIVLETTDYHSMGRARNEAIEKTTTDWVVYMDVDDVMRPNAIADSIPYFDVADVIVWNAIERGGPLDGNHRIWKDSMATGARRAGHLAPSPSPFRRAFWERCPYLEIPPAFLGIDGASDTLLWLGFAGLGAIFHNLKGIQFEYIHHADSMVHSKTPEELAQRQWFTEFLGEKFPRDPESSLTSSVRVRTPLRRQIAQWAKEHGLSEADALELAWRLVVQRENA